MPGGSRFPVLRKGGKNDLSFFSSALKDPHPEDGRV